MTLQSKVSYGEQLEEGQKVLQSYLSVRGITDPAEQQEICSLILKEQPYLLANLYTADYYNSMDTGVIYNSITDYYHKCKKEMALVGYLERNGIHDAEEQQKIYGMILKKQPDMLESLYMAVSNGEDSGTIYASIMDYYNKHKWDISIEDVEGLDMGEQMDQRQKETFAACWNRLRQMGISEKHTIAVMANIFAESRFSATNAQESQGYKGLYDKYEFAVDDGVGYGICQWTVDSRKKALLEYANSTNGSVYELETQLNYFQYEMENGICKGYWKTFLKKKTIYEATEYFMDIIENPLVNNIKTRMNYANIIEEWYLTKEEAD